VSDLGATFAALADPTRRQVMSLLADRGSGTATEIARELPVSRQAVAKHLTALDTAGLVAGRREGRETRYRLTPQPLEQAVAWMASVGAEWDERLARLQGYVQRNLNVR
jgi:DNA-binding transcriptional ArsR family regulator